MDNATAMTDMTQSDPLRSAVRQVLLARRRALLLELADLERVLCVGRYAGRTGPLALDPEDLPVDIIHNVRDANEPTIKAIRR